MKSHYWETATDYRASVSRGLAPLSGVIIRGEFMLAIIPESVNSRPARPDVKSFQFPEGVTRRDRPLGYHWSADYDALNTLIGLPPCASKKMERVMASIVVDVMLAGPFQRTSYSRSHDFYAASARYRGIDYGYDTVVGAVDRLVAAELLIEHRKAESSSIGSGWQSSFIGSPALYRVREIPTVARRRGEVIRLKEAKTGKLIDYRETRRTVADRKITEGINARIRNAKIVLDAPTIAEQNAHVIHFKVDDDHGEHAVYPEKIELYRVYNGGWNLGGRYYGGWWQSVRSADRKHFVIDGEPTVEEDYEQLHPRLLYPRGPPIRKRVDVRQAETSESDPVSGDGGRRNPHPQPRPRRKTPCGQLCTQCHR
jgi:hypothetical protein